MALVKRLTKVVEKKTDSSGRGKGSNVVREQILGVAILPRIVSVVVIIVVFCYTRDYLISRYSDVTEFGEKPFVSVGQKVPRSFMTVQCSNDYDKRFKDCSPKKCGRVVMDGIINSDESEKLLNIALKGMSYGGSAGGPTILDLHSGALTRGQKFINIYKVFENQNKQIFTQEDFKVYRTTKNKIRDTIANEFRIDKEKLYLTKPTFFSRMTSKPARTKHDEYWHPHVDRITYESFYYTSLLYLSDYNKNFTGGRFVFVDSNANHTVEPRVGRLSFFTSGSENVHHVEKVSSGTRYAITVSFTCDKKYAIPDPDPTGRNI